MIARGYQLHLYCDCEECESSREPNFAEFVGESWSGTSRNAKAVGWRISRDKRTAFAPGHTFRRKE